MCTASSRQGRPIGRSVSTRDTQLPLGLRYTGAPRKPDAGIPEVFGVPHQDVLRQGGGTTCPASEGRDRRPQGAVLPRAPQSSPHPRSSAGGGGWGAIQRGGTPGGSRGPLTLRGRTAPGSSLWCVNSAEAQTKAAQGRRRGRPRRAGQARPLPAIHTRRVPRVSGFVTRGPLLLPFRNMICFFAVNR